MRAVSCGIQTTQDHEDGAVGPKFALIHGIHPAAAVYVLCWDVRYNEQDHTFHQHGGCNKQ